MKAALTRLHTILWKTLSDYFQVRPIRLKDYNQRTGKSYTMKDMYDYDKALEVFMYYCTEDIEQTAKNWNGSGKKTIDYWLKVKKELGLI